MKRQITVTILLALTTLSAPSEVHGQWGAVLDWINGLSGPRLVRVGPELAVAHLDEDRNRVNLAALFAVAVDDRGNPDTDAADISAFGIQATLESTLIGEAGAPELRSRLGFELHRFAGEFDSFWAPSFPLLVSLYVPLDGWALKVGTGFNVFSFPDDAFSPYDVGVETSGFDAGWTVQVGVELGDFALID